MNTYKLLVPRQPPDGPETVTKVADEVSSNMGGVLFFHRKTGKVEGNTLPRTIDPREKIEETEVIDIYAPGRWLEVHKL